MTKYAHWLLGMLLAVPALHAADVATGWQHIGALTHVGTVPGGVEVEAGRARVRVLAISDSVIRVRLSPDGSFPPDFSWAVGDSARPATKVTVRDAPTAVELTTARLKVRIEKTPLRIVFLDLAGAVLQQD